MVFGLGVGVGLGEGVGFVEEQGTGLDDDLGGRVGIATIDPMRRAKIAKRRAKRMLWV